jgi:Ca2+-binding RTX toxin-like protein
VAAETQAPRLKNITLLSNAVSLTFDEALIGSTAMPDASTFSLNKYNGGGVATAVAVTGVEHPTDAQNNPVNDQFHIKFAAQTLVDASNAYMKLSYTDPSRAAGQFSADDANALQDSTGNDMPNFNVVVYNNSANSETGTTSIDYIMGGGGNDNIRGNSGNDVLWGNGTNGSGSDNDTFIWNLNDQGGSGATDVIKDFVRWNGTSGDKLSIYLLLSGFTNGTSTLSDWVKTVATDQTVNGVANSTVMTIDVDGSGTGVINQVIQFEGVNLLSGVTGANLTDQLSRLQSDGVFTA